MAFGTSKNAKKLAAVVESFPMKMKKKKYNKTNWKEEKMVSDYLELKDKNELAKMLDKYGNVGKKETIYLTSLVIKINHRDKLQTRVMIITDKAVYNLDPSKLETSKRRIALEKITSVTCSAVSEEFILHIPDEYDFRYRSMNKDKIAEVIAFLHHQKLDKESSLATCYVETDDLKAFAITKNLAKVQTRAHRLKRKAQLLAIQTDSDDEDEGEAEKEKIANYQFELGQVDERKCGLDDFELLSVLGKGSFGKVMQVKHIETGQIYAMKILKKKAIIQRNQVEHTKAERQILEILDHPFCMNLRYAFQTTSKLYLVLDYIPGGELFHHLKRNKRFPERIAKIWVAQVALAIGHLHSLSFIYRDLKPENILLARDGNVCLTDFGLSKDVQPDDICFTFCGTPEYLAPEIVNNAGHGKAVDWWSLGILLYELTVGIPPFYHPQIPEMYKKIKKGVLKIPIFLSEECKSIIIKLLNRDPKKRLGSEDDIEDIKNHPFFKEIDWDKMMKKEYDINYKPKVSSKKDTSNFDPAFTTQIPVDSFGDDNVPLNSDSEEEGFEDFSFNHAAKHLKAQRKKEKEDLFSGKKSETGKML